jgi:hypothetical protein
VNPVEGPAIDSAVIARYLQAELKRVGCDPGAVDGHWGTRAKEALREFNLAAKATLSVESPTEDALRAVGARKGHVCALSCNPNEEQRAGRCVARVNADRTRARANEKPQETTGKETGTTKLCWGTHSGVTMRPCTGALHERPAN